MTPLFQPLRPSRRLRGTVERIVAVRDGPNPSFDYYLRPRLERGAMPFEVRDLKSPPGNDPDPALWRGTLILFCRYLSGAWLDVVERHGGSLAGAALFLDDDIDALFTDASIPLWYRLRLYRRHLRYRARLRHCLDLLLVSNPRISARHGLEGCPVLSPVAAADDEPTSRDIGQEVRIAFHATSIHRREHLWLRSIVRSALAAEPRLRAEIVAPPLLGELWRRLPRTKVVAPLAWPEFRRATARGGADLLLTPLLPSAANAARAPTKRIDAMRLGAGMLTNDADVYRPTEEEIGLGMCVPADPGAWARAIEALARDRDRLARLRDLNRARVDAWGEQAAPSLDSIFAVLRPSE